MATVSIRVIGAPAGERRIGETLFEVTFEVLDSNVDAITPSLIDAAKSVLWRGRVAKDEA